MITCANCQSPQYLQIVASKVYFSNGKRISEVEESYECTLCNGTGKLRIWSEDGLRRTSISGDIEETDDRPQVSP